MIWEAGQLVSPIKQEGKVGEEEDKGEEEENDKGEEEEEEEERQIISRKMGWKAIFVCGLLSALLSLYLPHSR